MTKTCPACGFVSNAEARFCRMCGALLPRANDADEASVSPIAATVPLSGPDTATDALSPHDTGSPNLTNTSDLRRNEMDELLRRSTDDASRALRGDLSRPTQFALEDDPHEDAAADESRPLRIRVRPIEQIPNAASMSQAADARDAPLTNRPESPSPARLDATRDTSARDGCADSDLDHASSDLDRASSDLHHATVDPGRASSGPVATSGPVAGPESSASSDLSRADSGAAAPPQAAAQPAPSRSQTTPPTERRAMRLWAGAAVFAVVALVVASCLVLAWYVVHRTRAPNSAAEGAASVANTAPATEDAKQAEAAKLKEADDLIAAGRADEATARLREAASLDPSDAEPHRRLARLLDEGGARRMAITELQTVTRLAPDDAAAWRDLAAAQSAEGDYAAAADSYHTLFGLSGEATADDRLQLAYADALRQSGRAREAQSLYKRLANSRVAEVARASRQQLGNLNSNESKNANTNAGGNANESANATAANSANNAARPAETPRPQESNDASAQARPSPASLPADASPRDHYERGLQLWRTNRAAALTEFGAASQGGNPDADYYLGLNLAEGRDPRSLRRGELLAALNYFQRARRGHFAPDARRYEDALLKEYDRRSAGNANQQH